MFEIDTRGDVSSVKADHHDDENKQAANKPTKGKGFIKGLKQTSQLDLDKGASMISALSNDMRPGQGAFIDMDTLKLFGNHLLYTKSKSKYIDVKKFVVYNEKHIDRMINYITDNKKAIVAHGVGDSKDFLNLAQHLGKGHVDAETTSNGLTKAGVLSLRNVSKVIKILEDCKTKLRKDENILSGNGKPVTEKIWSSDQLNSNFNDAAAILSNDNPVIKQLNDDYKPWSFDKSSTVTSMFGTSLRDDNNLKPSSEDKLFKLIGDEITGRFNDSVVNGLDYYLKSKDGGVVSFPAGASSGLVSMTDPKFAKFNFTFDNNDRRLMYDSILKLDYASTMDLVRSGLKLQGSRLQLYPNAKKNLRPAYIPVFTEHDDPYNFKNLKPFELKRDVQNSVGLNIRNVTSVQNGAQAHASIIVQAISRGMDDFLKSMLKFTAHSLKDTFDKYDDEGFMPFTCDVSSSEYNIDVESILEMFFKGFMDGKFYDMMKVVYEETDSIGLFSMDETGIRLYLQKCGIPDRFISGSIFTSLANMWYYITVQCCNQVKLLAVLSNDISEETVLTHSYSDSQALQMKKKYLAKVKGLNQGDDSTDFIPKGQRSLNLFNKIIESCPYIKLSKEEDTGMVGKLVKRKSEMPYYREVSSNNDRSYNNDGYLTYAKAETFLFKTPEKMEGRTYGHPLRSTIFGSVKGKFDLGIEFPFQGNAKMTKQFIDVFTMSMNLGTLKYDQVVLLALIESASLISSEDEFIPDDKILDDFTFVRSSGKVVDTDNLPKDLDNINLDAETKLSEVLSKDKRIKICLQFLVKKFNLANEREIFYAIDAVDIAYSGAPFLDDLFILVPFRDIREFSFFSDYKYRHYFTLSSVKKDSELALQS